MKRVTSAVSLVVCSLAIAAAASAGGWATVGLSSTPEELSAGKTWAVDLKVLQHGRTPLADVKPTVTITGKETGKKLVFAAEPTDRVGVYRAKVKFPAAGTWSYEVDDGFGRTHTFAPVEIARAADGGGIPAWLLAGGLIVALAASLLVVLPRLRRGRIPAIVRP